MFKLCIFDLDGTLCDTLESISYCGNRALQDMGLPKAGLEDYKIFVGDGVDMLMKRMLAFAGDEEAVRFAELKESYTEYFREGCMHNVVPYPGMVQALDSLEKMGASMAVLSNKQHENTKAVIMRVFGESYFQCVQGQCEAFPRKPDPTAALFLAERLGAKPEECLYIGDTSTDMKTGKAAGMYTVGVLWGFRGEEELKAAGADEIVLHPSEIPMIFARK